MKPKIYLLGRPLFDVETFLSFLREEKTEWARSAQATQAEEIVEIAGRVLHVVRRQTIT